MQAAMTVHLLLSVVEIKRYSPLMISLLMSSQKEMAKMTPFLKLFGIRAYVTS